MSAAALLAAAVLAAPPTVPAGATGDLEVEAGTVVYDATRERWRIEGGAVLRRGVVVLRARSAEVDPRTGEVNAAGGVLLTDATRAVAADGLRAVLGGDFEAHGVVAFLKDGPVDLSAARDAEAARAVGTNRISLSAESLRGSGGRRDPILIQGARLTLCDCGPGEAPSWSLRAREANVIPGDRAILSWPVLYVKGTPVLPLPWLYVPLGDRQSGLLVPEIDSTGATGIAVVAPVFLTLGEQADATVSPGWAFGPEDGKNADRAVKGPTGTLEVRWAPAEDARGRALLTWLHDEIAEPGGASGNRFGLRLRHQQGAAARFALAADVALDEDGVMVRDLTSGSTARSAPYQRSSLLGARLAGPALVQAGTAYLQPLQPGGAGGTYGFAGVDVDLAHPLAWASATLPATSLGPVLASARAGVARFAPVHGGDDLAGRPEATRADARLQLEAPLLLGRALAFSPFVRGAAAAYSGGSGAVAWGLAGAALSTEVSRRFGSVRHVAGLSGEWRLGTPALGDAPPFPAYDALDRVGDSGSGHRLTAAPPGRFHQVRLAVNTRLVLGGGGAARLELGRDLDLEAGAEGDAFATGSFALGPVRADGSIRFPDLTRYGEASARLAVGDPRSHRAWAEYVGVRGPGSRLQSAGLDVLFDPRPLEQAQATEGKAGAQVKLGPALLAYQVTVPGRSGINRVSCDGRTLDAFEIQEQAMRLTWESPCRCFRASLELRVDACGNMDGLKGKIEIARPGESALR